MGIIGIKVFLIAEKYFLIYLEFLLR